MTTTAAYAASVAAAARGRAAHSTKAADRVAEICWLAETGEPLHAIAARLGVKPESVLRRLHRHGHHQVAAKIRNRRANL